MSEKQPEPGACECRKALGDVADDVCGAPCPSMWRTEDGRPPCHPKCQSVRAALSAPCPLEQERDQLRAAARELREALEPFAGMASEDTDGWPETMVLIGWNDEGEHPDYHPTIKDCRHAAAVLAKYPEGK